MAYVSLTTLNFQLIVVFYILKSGLCCFENSSTLIVVTTPRLLGALFKPLLAELGAKKDIKKQQQKTRGAKQAHRQAQWASRMMHD